MLSCLSFLSCSGFGKEFRRNIPETVHDGKATEPLIDGAEDNDSTTSAVTRQAVNTNDHDSTDQHDSTISRWKKVSWNATKTTLDLVASGAFPSLQTAAGLLLNLINRYEVRYSTLSL
jgi:hypothetical protein